MTEPQRLVQLHELRPQLEQPPLLHGGTSRTSRTNIVSFGDA